MNSSDVLDSFKSATLQTKHDSVWPSLESRIAGVPAASAEGTFSGRSRAALRAVGMLSVATLTFAVAVLPDYVPRNQPAGLISPSAPVSDISTGQLSRAAQRQPKLPGHLLPVYLEPSWQILSELTDEPVPEENSVRRGSL
jgi:hypothetical protein